MSGDSKLLAGKVGLAVGVANEHLIAAGCAKAFRAAGAEVALTYRNDRAKPFVAPVADAIDAGFLAPFDVEVENTIADALPSLICRNLLLVRSCQVPRGNS